MAHIELVPAALDQKPILANLLELYAHDFSEFHHLDLDAEARFGYEPLSLYWNEPHRHPFLIKRNGKLVGLALVKSESQTSDRGVVWDMGEFFIVRAYRRQGIGIKAAHEVWKKFPGPWNVRVMESNRTALNFWQHAIAAFNGQAINPARVEKDDQCWYVFAFESRQNSVQ